MNSVEYCNTYSTNESSTIGSTRKKGNIKRKDVNIDNKCVPTMPNIMNRSIALRLGVINEDFHNKNTSGMSMVQTYYNEHTKRILGSSRHYDSKSRNKCMNKTDIKIERPNSKVVSLTKHQHQRKHKISLTSTTIENGIKHLKHIIQTSPCSYSKEYINSLLRLKTPKIKEGKSNFNNFIYKNQAIISLRSKQINKPKSKSKLNETHPKWNQFVKVINNPSYGIDGIKKQYPQFTSNNSLMVTSTFPLKYRTTTLGSTMIAKRIDTKSKDVYTFDSTRKKQLTQASRLKLKCKMIKWFMDNKKDLLSRLLDPELKEQILKFTKKKSREFDYGLTIEDFSTLMQNNLITNDPELIQKLFWILDENGDNNLKYDEIVSGIEMFRDTSPEEKIKIFFRLCDTDKSNTVTREEFYNMLKRNIIDRNDIFVLKKSVEKLYKDKGNELTLEQFIEAFQMNKELVNIINNNTLALKTIDKGIDDDIKKDLMMFNAEQNIYIQQKIFGENYESCRIRENKFVNMVSKYTTNKEDQIERHKNEMNVFSDIDESETSFDNEALRKEEEEAFKNEKDIYQMVMNLNKK